MTELRPSQLSNGWAFHAASVWEVLRSEAVEQACDYVTRWARIFPSQSTWVGKEYGVPSLIIRVEGTYDEKHGWRIFEIEDRPCGVGVTRELNCVFAERLAQLSTQWPLFKWVRDPDRVTDDELWLGEGISLEQALTSKDLLLVRSRPENVAYHALEERAVSTVSREGEKKWLSELDMGTIVSWQMDMEEPGGGYINPAIGQPSVVKTLQGTRCRDVFVYLNGFELRKVPGEGRVPFLDGVRVIKEKGDTVSMDRLEKEVRRMGSALVQPFHMPMRLPHLPNLNAIYRFYFGFSPVAGQYVPLGGVYNATRSLKVHGERGAVFGPLDFG